jgi:hypothetical protein
MLSNPRTHAFFLSASVLLTLSLAHAGYAAAFNSPYAAPNLKDRIQCPAPSALVLNKTKRTWSAHNGWEPQSPSFINQPTQFLGAQWSGVQIGKLSCIYSGLPKGTFPVAITYGELTYDPFVNLPKNVRGSWGKNKKGTLFCYAHDPKQCPALMALRKRQNSIMDDASSLRDKALQVQKDTSGSNW